MKKGNSDEIISQFTEFYNDYDFDKITTASISEVMQEAYIGEPIKLLANIYSKSDPYPKADNYELNLPDNIILFEEGESKYDTEKTLINLVLKDNNGDEIKCIPIGVADFTNRFQRYFKNKGMYLFCGTIVKEDVDKGKKSLIYEYLFYLSDIINFVSHESLIGLRPERRKYIHELFQTVVTQPGGIRRYIKETLVKKLHIEGLDELEELNKAIDYMILQSLSVGFSGEGTYSNKLHSLIIGPPASGKKFLTAIAKILNPIAFELTATSGKLTPSGLIGNIKRANGLVLSEPGYLPLASGGVVCIQDFHQVTKNRDEILSIFTKVMEDGEVIDSTMAKTKHLAITSIHLDTNLYSQVKPNKQVGQFANLNISMEVLSRFDFILHISENPDRPYKIAKHLLGGDRILETKVAENVEKDKPIEADWARDLKVLIAYLATNFRYSIWSNDVGEYAKAKLDEIKKEITSEAELETMSKMWTRISISLKKISKAIACIDHRQEIIESDIDEAFSYIQYKIDYLSRMSELDMNATEESNPVSTIEHITAQDRQDEIIRILRLQPMRTQEILEKINSWSGNSYDRKTIGRDLNLLKEEGLVESLKQGVWSRVDSK
jgi:hypothetical protein